MDAFSLRGYCRTLSVLMACSPAMTMTKLTTMASTGRRTKMSVNDFILQFRNPNLETRNKCEIQNARLAHATQVFDHSTFENCFGFRHSCFEFRVHVCAGVGEISGLGASSLLITTGIPFRNLKTPELTTVSPGFNPWVTVTKSPRVSPVRINCCRITCDSLPVFSSFFFSMTKTESP